MQLKNQVQTIYRVDHEDLTDYVRQIYLKGDYDFLEYEEVTEANRLDDSLNAKEYEVYRTPLADYDQEDLESWVRGDSLRWIDTSVLLHDLAYRGLIQPGTYIIGVN